jgi:hypothetical protein
MPELAPLLHDQRKVDADHLRLLAIFHYVVAGLTVVGIGFLFLHYTILSAIFDNPEMWKEQKNGAPPAEFFAIFKWVYVVLGVLIVADGLVNLLSGRFLQRRKHRMFSLVVAGLNCLQFPFGSVLGVFTFIVLLRDSVRQMYEERSAK